MHFGSFPVVVGWVFEQYLQNSPVHRDNAQTFLKDEFDVAYDEGTTFLLTMHPHVIGHRSRIVVLRELIEHIRTKPDVWFGTHEQAVRWVRQEAGMD